MFCFATRNKSLEKIKMIITAIQRFGGTPLLVITMIANLSAVRSFLTIARFFCLFDWFIGRFISNGARINKWNAKASSKLIMIHTSSHIWISVHCVYTVYSVQSFSHRVKEKTVQKQINRVMQLCLCCYVCDCDYVLLLFHYYGVSYLHWPVQSLSDRCF